MNIYRAKRFDSDEIVEGQYYYECFYHYLIIYSDMGLVVRIDPSTLEVIQLDLNDEQKLSLLNDSIRSFNLINIFIRDWVLHIHEMELNKNVLLDKANFIFQESERILKLLKGVA